MPDHLFRVFTIHDQMAERVQQHELAHDFDIFLEEQPSLDISERTRLRGLTKVPTSYSYQHIISVGGIDIQKHRLYDQAYGRCLVCWYLVWNDGQYNPSISCVGFTRKYHARYKATFLRMLILRSWSKLRDLP